MKASLNKIVLSSEEETEFQNYVALNLKRAYFSALSLTGSHDDAMELSQQAFIRAYRNYASFDKRKKFFTWYYKILRNLCLNFLRDRKNKKQVAILDYIDYCAEESGESEYEKEELKNILERAIFELEPEDREILIYREFENFSYKDIAELLDIPEGTVMSKLYYARKKLAKRVKEKI